MRLPWSIRIPAATALLAAGCAVPLPLSPTPLGQDDLDQFLASGRDARIYGITIYPDAAGTRFEFANRPHPDRTARLAFLSPKNSPVPIVGAATPLSDQFPLLLDTSARQSWAAMQSIRGLEYRLFKPPVGEYADHAATTIPGYAGVGNQLILDGLYVENPIFYLLPARGGLSALTRVGENPQAASGAAPALEKIARRMPVVAGAALLRSCAFVRFDFPNRSVGFSTRGAYQPAAASAVLARLPLRTWRGRPALQAILDGIPLTLVIDTAGNFDVSLPGDSAQSPATLTLGELQIDGVNLVTHAGLGLPEKFPARLGLGVLARFAVTLDYKQQLVWLEGKPLPVPQESATSPADGQAPTPVHYRGITQ